MEWIARLEPVPRGLYTGAIGYFAFNGDAVFNIAIRTLLRDGDELHYHVGAGITADSIPSREYDETMQKGVGLRHAVTSFVAAEGILHGARLFQERE
jgi:anthranilate/para-aminobenzoate synthase component I